MSPAAAAFASAVNAPAPEAAVDVEDDEVGVDVTGADAAAGDLVEDPQPAATALNARTTNGIVKRR
jgi:hypothetical protein